MRNRNKQKRSMAPLCLLILAVSSGIARAAEGEVTLDEFRKDVLRSWHALDLDGDGYITQAELKALPKGARGMLGSLKRADTDGDGRLSFKEVVAARMAAFEAADTNGDDRLSKEEIAAYEAKLRAERKSNKAPAR